MEGYCIIGIGRTKYEERTCGSRTVGGLCLRRFRYQRPPRIAIPIARRPSVRPTASGTVLLVGVACNEVGISRGILCDRRREKRSQLFHLYRPTSLMTDREKPRPNDALSLSCSRLRLTVCRPGPGSPWVFTVSLSSTGYKAELRMRIHVCMSLR